MSSRQHRAQPYMERGVGLSLLVSLLKFNDSSAQQPGETLAAVNPRFNQVDKDAEWICVETMISSDQGRCRPPTCCEDLKGPSRVAASRSSSLCLY